MSNWTLRFALGSPRPNLVAKLTVLIHPRVEMLHGAQVIGFPFIARGVGEHEIVAKVHRIS